MDIVINTIPLLGPMTGVGTYVDQISHSLRQVDGNNRYTYYYGFYTNRIHSVGASTGAVAGATRLLKGLDPVRRVARKTLSFVHSLSRRSFDLYFEPNFIPVGIRSRRTVVTVHDLSSVLYPHWHPADRVEYFKRNFRSQIGRADRIIVPSDFIRHSVIEELGLSREAVVKISHGFDRTIFRSHDETETTTIRARYKLPESFILSIGTLEPRKNLEGLLRAFEELEPELRRQFPLVLTGPKGWRDERLLDTLRAAGPSVTYLGYVPRDDLGRILSAASLFVFPSFYEGFGLPPLEAMACGCPVVVSNTSSLPEVCGEAAIYIDPEDHAGMVSVISRVLGDDALMDQMRQKGFEQAGLFSWERSAREHLAVFEGIG